MGGPGQPLCDLGRQRNRGPNTQAGAAPFVWAGRGVHRGLSLAKPGLSTKRPQDVPGTESIPLPSPALTKPPPLSRRSEQQMPKKPDRPFQERNGAGLRPWAPPA